MMTRMVFKKVRENEAGHYGDGISLLKAPVRFFLNANHGLCVFRVTSYEDLTDLWNQKTFLKN
jgi:hypothetical protein